MPAIFHIWNFGHGAANGGASSGSASDVATSTDQSGEDATLADWLLTTTTATIAAASDSETAALNQTSTSSSTTTSTLAPFVHRANFVWYEDWDDVADTPIPNQPYHRYVELSPLLPFGMMLIISTIIFMLIIFRRWPGLVAGIVAGCLTSISIYLLLLTLKEQKLVYE